MHGKRHDCLRKTRKPLIPINTRIPDLFCAKNDYRNVAFCRRAKPNSDYASPPTPSATPAVTMELTVGGRAKTAQELNFNDWTPVLYKAYASRPASSQKPPYRSENATSDAAKPHSKNAARDAAAATGSGKTPARVPPAIKEARLAVQGSKQLRPLAPNAIRVLVRPGWKLHLQDIPTPLLLKAVQAELKIIPPDGFCLRIHLTNNTFTMETTHIPTAEVLKTLTSLTFGDHSYPSAAYVAPTPGATRGVITNAYEDNTTTQLYQYMVRRNSEYSIQHIFPHGKDALHINHLRRNYDPSLL
ncbi:hypothetical protein V5799_009673 [Amblyomma americanum]|uniref:Uncharacterized protein n=1 Tax=Amblyomma americanum TaxID=6943 RepID=A0AAQ4FB25_AMBAM